MELNTKNIRKKNKPYTYFFIDNIFDNNIYEDLQFTFPTLNNYRLITSKSSSNKASNKDGKWIFDKKNYEKWNHFFLNPKNNNWKNLIKIINSEKFLNDLKNLFYEDLKLSHKNIVDKKWVYDDDSSDEEVFENFEIMEKPNIQFTKMENGSFLLPHKDSPNKVFTLIFYFPSKNWILNDSRGGGTNIHKVYYPEASVDFRNIYYQFSEFTKHFESIDYKSNRLMGFIKDKKSYHSIGPIESKESVYRDAFVVNISTKNYPSKAYINKYFFKSLEIFGKLMFKLTIIWKKLKKIL